MENSIRNLVNSLVAQIIAAVQADIAQRMGVALSSVFSMGGIPQKRGPGRPPRNPQLLPLGNLFPPVANSPVRKRAKQLCPVPNCKALAAPVFGMVCAEHKDLPKAQIKKYRNERLEAKKEAKAAKKEAKKEAK